MANSSKSAQFLTESRLVDQATGQNGAMMYDLGVAYSTGSGGVRYDLIEAHKWFNQAAVAGFLPAQIARAEIATDMSPRDIAEAQRQARNFLYSSRTPQMRAA